MSTTTYWAPNQAAVAQVRQYTFTAPSSIGNTYSATINGKTVTYSSVSGDTAALAASGLLALLNVSTGIAPELTEITWANPSSGVLTATASAPGTPFAGVTVGGVANQGLVLSTGNGLANGIATVELQANQSPSDVFDAQNWWRVNLATTPPSRTRAVPQAGDDVVVADSGIPLLWNLDRLSGVAFNSYARWQSFEGTIGLPDANPNGYTEWRATYFAFSGPAGSAPAGGLAMVLGYSPGSGGGPSRERYSLGSSRYTCRAIAAGGAADAYGVRLLGYHTDNAVYAENGVSVGVAMGPGETSTLNLAAADGGATVAVGAGATWATNIFGTAATVTANAANLLLNAAPPTLAMSNGAQATFATDGLVWPSITVQGGCNLTWLAGGTVTALTMSVGCVLDKSGDNRALTITNHTIDGDSCVISDPLNAITFTNAGTVKQAVTSGPYVFTGTRTVRII